MLSQKLAELRVAAGAKLSLPLPHLTHELLHEVADYKLPHPGLCRGGPTACDPACREKGLLGIDFREVKSLADSLLKFELLENA
jgi:hypothetical protein